MPLHITLGYGKQQYNGYNIIMEIIMDMTLRKTTCTFISDEKSFTLAAANVLLNKSKDVLLIRRIDNKEIISPTVASL